MRCISCDHVGLCAPDCPIAPWNDGHTRLAPPPFAYLLRQRRWARYPADRRDAWFKNDAVRAEQERRFYG